PTVYLGHGAPPLVDDPIWPGELAAWAAALPRPKAILVISAHWENAPLTIGATTPVPLVYDFSGFPEKYYRVTYPAPGAPALARPPARRRPGPGVGGSPMRGPPRRSRAPTSTRSSTTGALRQGCRTRIRPSITSSRSSSRWARASTRRRARSSTAISSASRSA